MSIILCYLLIRGPEDMFFIFLVSTVQFSAASFFEPAHAGITPSVVAPEVRPPTPWSFFFFFY